MQETGSPGDRSNLTNVSRAALFERLFKLGVLVILLAVLAVACVRGPVQSRQHDRQPSSTAPRQYRGCVQVERYTPDSTTGL